MALALLLSKPRAYLKVHHLLGRPPGRTAGSVAGQGAGRLPRPQMDSGELR
jgi:hypothetical protein